MEEKMLSERMERLEKRFSDDLRRRLGSAEDQHQRLETLMEALEYVGPIDKSSVSFWKASS